MLTFAHTSSLLTKTLIVAGCALATGLTACIDEGELAEDPGLFAGDDADPVAPRTCPVDCTCLPGSSTCLKSTNTSVFAENEGLVNLKWGFVMGRSVIAYGWNYLTAEPADYFKHNNPWYYHKITGGTCAIGTPPFQFAVAVKDWDTLDDKFTFRYLDLGGVTQTLTDAAVVGCSLNITVTDAGNANPVTGVLKIVGAQHPQVIGLDNSVLGNRWQYNIGVSDSLRALSQPSNPVPIVECVGNPCGPSSKYALCPDAHRTDLAATPNTWAVVRDGLITNNSASPGWGWKASAGSAALTCLTSASGKSARWSMTDSPATLAAETAVIGLLTPTAYAVSSITYEAMCASTTCTQTGLLFAAGMKAGVNATGYPVVTDNADFPGGADLGHEALFNATLAADGWWRGKATCKSSSPTSLGLMTNEWVRTAGSSLANEGAGYDWDTLSVDENVDPNFPDCSTYIANGGPWMLKSYAFCRYDNGIHAFPDDGHRCDG